MKNVMIAAALTLGLTATVATAGEIAFVGNVEYAFETEVFETNVGVEYATGVWTITPLLSVAYDDVNDLDFAGAEVTVSYEVNTSWDVYGTVEADSDFEYEEFTVGAAFRF